MVAHYCTLDDVNNLAPQVPFNDTSRPSATVVSALIESVAKRIDAVLRNLGYAVPVTSGDNSILMLQEACAWGALGLAQQIRDTGVSTAVSDRPNTGKNVWTKLFEEWLDRLADPEDPFELPDAVRTSEQLEKQPENLLRSFVQGVTDDPDYKPNCPEITRNQRL